MEKISWTDHVRNEEVLLRVNEQRNNLHEIRKRKAKLNWSHLTKKLPSKTGYRMTDKGTDGSDKKTRKKT